MNVEQKMNPSPKTKKRTHDEAAAATPPPATVTATTTGAAAPPAACAADAAGADAAAEMSSVATASPVQKCSNSEPLLIPSEKPDDDDSFKCSSCGLLLISEPEFQCESCDLYLCDGCASAVDACKGCAAQSFCQTCNDTELGLEQCQNDSGEGDGITTLCSTCLEKAKDKMCSECDMLISEPDFKCEHCKLLLCEDCASAVDACQDCDARPFCTACNDSMLGLENCRGGDDSCMHGGKFCSTCFDSETVVTNGGDPEARRVLQVFFLHFRNTGIASTRHHAACTRLLGARAAGGGAGRIATCCRCDRNSDLRRISEKPAELWSAPDQ